MIPDKTQFVNTLEKIFKQGRKEKMTDLRVEVFKKEFPDTQLKRGSLLAIFGMWKYEGRDKMIEYLQFLYDIGIVTGIEMTRIAHMMEDEE